VLALLVEGLLITALINLYGYEMPGIGSIVSWSLAGVILFILNIYFYAILATIIMSFVMLFSGSMNPHPILQLIWQLTEPVMAPIRNIIPPMGGLDFSPIFIFLGIEFLSSFLMEVFGISEGVRQVIVGV
jgi:YggT family protein